MSVANPLVCSVAQVAPGAVTSVNVMVTGPELPRRLAVLRGQLERLAADILCLQEVNGQKPQAAAPRRLLVLDRLLEGTPYAAFARASTLSPDGDPADVHNLVGVCLMLQNNFLNARDYFSQALILDKYMGNAHYNLGRVQYGLNDKNAAIQSLNDAYSMLPKDSNIVALLSQIYLEQQDYKNAEKFLAKLYALNKSNEKVGWNLVNIARKNKDYEHVAIYLQNIIRVNPKNPQGYIELGETYVTTNNYEQAFNNYENAISKLGESRDFLYNAGMCANHIGIYGKAVEYLSKAISLDASYAKSYKELGDAYTGLKKKKQAKQNYKKANSLGYEKEPVVQNPTPEVARK